MISQCEGSHYRAECLLDYGREPGLPSEPASSLPPLGSVWHRTQDFLLVSRPVVERALEQLEAKREQSLVRPKETLSTAAERLRERLHVARVEETQLTRLSYEDTDPSRAARIVNAIAEAYLVKAAEDRTAASERALSWLSAQAADTSRRLAETEGELQLYVERTRASAMPLDEQQKMLAEQLKQVNQNVVETRLRRIALTAQVAKLKRASEIDDPFRVHALEIDQNEQAKQLQAAQIAHVLKLRTLEASHGGTGLEVVLAQNQLAAMRDQMKQVIAGILQAYQAELAATQEIEAQLQATVAELSSQGRALQRHKIEYGRLAREREHMESALDTLRGRSVAAGLAKATGMAGPRVVEPAHTPQQSLSAPTTRNVLLGALAGLAVGTLVITWLRRFARSATPRSRPH